MRQKQQAGDFAGVQAALGRLQSAREQLGETESLMQEQTLVAPEAGRVLHRELRNMTGSYFEAGAEVLAIGDDARKELRISVDQTQMEGLEKTDDPTVRVRIPGKSTFLARLHHIEPVASTKPLHLSLCANHGGTLPVVVNDQNEPRLVEPRFTAIVTLPAELAKETHAGRRATAIIECERRPLYRYLRSQVGAWIDRRS